MALLVILYKVNCFIFTIVIFILIYSPSIRIYKITVSTFVRRYLQTLLNCALKSYSKIICLDGLAKIGNVCPNFMDLHYVLGVKFDLDC